MGPSGRNTQAFFTNYVMPTLFLPLQVEIYQIIAALYRHAARKISSPLREYLQGFAPTVTGIFTDLERAKFMQAPDAEATTKAVKTKVEGYTG